MSDSDLPHVRGFRFAGVAAGIKKKPGALDLGAIVADAPARVAALFTTNLVKAAPVLLAAERVRSGRARALLVNAGCANACTGPKGLDAARSTTRMLAQALGVGDDDVLPASTGVIGAQLPVARFEAAIPSLVADLHASHVMHFADAICTTDRWRKVSDASARIEGCTLRALGIAKGAGMIHPNMATTLVFVLTDADVSAASLRRALRDAASDTMNAISVDGDTSTNDALIALASGAAPKASGIRSKTGLGQFTDLLRKVLDPLARSIVADGEGAEHLVTIEVNGTRNDADARTIARTIATSPLVKTALYGQDPNWGRILAAAGRAGVAFDPDEASIHVGDVAIVRNGCAVDDRAAETFAHEVMRRPAYRIAIKVGRGRGTAMFFTCDLGHGYIDVNANYRS